MKLEINSHTFLQFSIDTGASYALPVRAIDAQVDKVWVSDANKTAKNQSAILL